MSDIYLDNNATTMLDPRVLEAMLPTLREVGNPASAHQAGQRARNSVEKARRQVAELLGSSPRELVFTSGATEANNLALKGVARQAHGLRRRIVSATTEHPSILQTLEALTCEGFEIVLVDVDSEGMVELESLQLAVNDETLLVTIMAANNETGVLAPLAAIAEIAHDSGALLHSDATQLLAWGGLDVEAIDVDLLSLSGHKMHGPQGVGALYVGRQVAHRLVATQHGGGHEHGLRSGTLNTAGIVGLGAAAELAQLEGPAAAVRVRVLRDALHHELQGQAWPVVLNGHLEQRLPGTLNLSFLGADAEAIMAGVPGVAIASGSACSTGHPGPSHVLTAMGIGEEQAGCSLRFGLSRMTIQDDVSMAATLLGASASRVRNTSREAVAL
jgi:cysteine desulfurase